MKPNFLALIAASALTTLVTGSIATAGPAPEHPGRFARMDANKDGKISQAEWTQAAAARFQAMDTDKDGTLSNAEMPKRHGRGHGGRFGRGHHGGPDGKPAPAATPAPAQ